MYSVLRANGFDVRGEVRTQYGTSRFDLVIFDSCKRATIILEIKKRKPIKCCKRDEKKDRSQQRKRYESFGVHVEMITGMSMAKCFCDQFLANNKPL